MRQIILLLLFVLGLGAAEAQQTTRSRLLALDAGQKYAEALAATDSAKRLSLLDKASAQLDRLTADFPDSEEARRIEAGGAVAGVSRAALQTARRQAQQSLLTAGAPAVGPPDDCLAAPQADCLFELAIDASRGADTIDEHFQVLADIAIARAEVGEFEAGLDLARLIPNPGPKGDGFRAIRGVALEMARAGRLEQAFEAEKLLPLREQRASVRVAAVVALLEAGEPGRVETMLEEMPFDTARARALAALASYKQQNGDAAGAEAAFTKAIELANRLRERRARDEVLFDLATRLAASGRLARAMGLADLILDQGVQRRAAAAVAKLVAAAGDTTTALSLSERLTSEAERAKLVIELAEDRAEAGSYAAAVSLINRIGPPLARARVLTNIAAQPLTVAQGTQLYEAAAALEDVPDRAWAGAIAARAVARGGEAVPASRMIGATAGVVAKLEPWDQVPARLELAAAQVEVGDPGAARTTLSGLPKGAVWYEGVAALAETLAAAEHRAAAPELAAAFEAELDRVKLQVLFSTQLAKSGEVPAALQVAAAIGRAREREYALFGVAKAQLAQGDSDGAQQTFAQAVELQKDPFLMHEFALAQAASGDLRGAAATAARIEGAVRRAQALKGVAAAAAGRRG